MRQEALPGFEVDLPSIFEQVFTEEEAAWPAFLAFPRGRQCFEAFCRGLDDGHPLRQCLIFTVMNAMIHYCWNWCCLPSLRGGFELYWALDEHLDYQIELPYRIITNQKQNIYILFPYLQRVIFLGNLLAFLQYISRVCIINLHYHQKY